MTKIYIVKGSSGYNDMYSVWTLKIFTSREKANELCSEANRQAKLAHDFQLNRVKEGIVKHYFANINGTEIDPNCSFNEPNDPPEYIVEEYDVEKD